MLAVHLPFPESVAKLLSADRLTWLADGKEMLRVPAGEFLYGDDKQRISAAEFWIDKTPVTNAEFERFAKLPTTRRRRNKKVLAMSGVANSGTRLKAQTGGTPTGPKPAFKTSWDIRWCR